jgi:hypothetical protein
MRALIFCLIFAGWGPLVNAGSIEIESPSRIVLRGFNDAELRSLKRDSLQVFIASSDNDVPLLGEGHIERTFYVFVPRYPLRAGVEYRAVCKQLDLDEIILLSNFPDTEAAEVTAVYPSGDELPENLLKFYVCFSASMSRGDSYKHIELLDEQGVRIDLPFVELAEELWDADQRRMTLLLDPGRIKRGLKPNKEVGPPLVAGRSYTLLIKADWPDAERRPLRREFRKRFRVSSFDATSPNLASWRIENPRSGSTSSLAIRFPEPIDYALLQNCLVASGPDGNEVTGEIKISNNETLWQFTPKVPWTVGRHVILVDTRLEDLAGNSIQRPFEVDESTPPEAVPSEIKLAFEVR